MQLHDPQLEKLGLQQKRTGDAMFKRRDIPTLAQETYLKSCQSGRPSSTQKLPFNNRHADKENIKPNKDRKRYHMI